MSTTNHRSRWQLILLMLALTLPVLAISPAHSLAQDTTRTFPETGYTVSGIFLQYWNTHGSLAQQGYPISDEMQLPSTDGKTYTTQFFQRAVFERHPEYAGTPNEVLLKLSGQTFYDRHFANTPPPNQTVNPTNTLPFQETGHSIGGKFRAYWEQHGGLAQQGYPMTGEFTMQSTDGKEYTTQVFQRAVFELHPEFAGTENEVELRLLGVEELAEMNKPTATPVPTETVKITSSPTATSVAGNNGLGPEDYQTTFVDKNGNQHKFTYDNAPSSQGLPRLALTLATGEDKSDYAELLKRTGRTSDFTFKVVGYDDSTGNPPDGWQMAGVANVNGGPLLSYIGRFDANRNLEIKYRNKNTFNQIVNDPHLAHVYGTLIGSNTIKAVLSQDENVGTTSQNMYEIIGSDAIAMRIYHKMGYNVAGYDSNFAVNAWPSFWTLQQP